MVKKKSGSFIGEVLYFFKTDILKLLANSYLCLVSYLGGSFKKNEFRNLPITQYWFECTNKERNVSNSKFQKQPPEGFYKKGVTRNFTLVPGSLF